MHGHIVFRGHTGSLYSGWTFCWCTDVLLQSLNWMMVLQLKYLVKPIKPALHLLRLHLSTCANQEVIKSISALTCRLNARMYIYSVLSDMQFQQLRVLLVTSGTQRGTEKMVFHFFLNYTRNDLCWDLIALKLLTWHEEGHLACRNPASKIYEGFPREKFGNFV